MKTKFTPGPWIVNGPWHIEAETVPVGRRSNGELIPGQRAIVAHVMDYGPREANARLIASAPELLEALQGILGICEVSPTGPFKPDILRIAKTAIAKAKGET